jgi:hypothetical protein
MEDGLDIGRRGLGNITTKFTKMIICLKSEKLDTNKRLLRRAAVFFPDIKHHFYIPEVVFKIQF